MINLTINDIPVQGNEGETILEVAHKLGIDIPTLCHLKVDSCNIESKSGSCRVCVVEVDGRPNLSPSCCTPATEGMKVSTSSMRVINARRTMLDLLLSDHPKDCLTCEKNGNCQLQNLAAKMGLHRIKYAGEMSEYKIDLSNESIVRDLNKCIMCRRCETACNVVQTVGVLSGRGRGFEVVVGPAGLRPLSQTECVYCGQCVSACPVGALTEMDHTYSLWNAINNPQKTVVVQTAPAVRVAIGEEFGLAPGTVATGKMITALKMMGFNKVFDTNFSADLTIMEEATEFISRLKENRNLPILTSCCPAWVKFFEHQFQDLMHIPSTCKSPQQMFGAIAKTYYAQKIGVKPEDMVVVSVMPCLAKKYESAREEFKASGYRDVDIVISARELAAMIKEAGIAFTHLEDGTFDDPLGESTGAGVIFGSSGGVLEAALRTAADWVGKNLQQIDFTSVRGLEGIKEATVKVGDIELRAAISSGLGNTRKLLEKIRRGEASYHIIEIMACPGGCINGGGMPYIKGDGEIIRKRMQAIYSDDKNSKIRKSHENPSIKRLYSEFLEKPGSPKAHELLHTHYKSRNNA